MCRCLGAPGIGRVRRRVRWAEVRAELFSVGDGGVRDEPLEMREVTTGAASEVFARLDPQASVGSPANRAGFLRDPVEVKAKEITA